MAGGEGGGEGMCPRPGQGATGQSQQPYLLPVTCSPHPDPPGAGPSALVTARFWRRQGHLRGHYSWPRWPFPAASPGRTQESCTEIPCLWRPRLKAVEICSVLPSLEKQWMRRTPGSWGESAGGLWLRQGEEFNQRVLSSRKNFPLGERD